MKLCTNPGCDEEVHPARWALGYKTCIYCGSPKKEYTVAIAYNKGAYQLISENDIQYIGRK